MDTALRFSRARTLERNCRLEPRASVGGGAFNQPRDHQAEVPPTAFRFSTFLLALILPAFSVQPSQHGCRGISCRNHAWPGFCGP